MTEDKLILQQVQEEQYQGHSTRKRIYQELEREIGMPIISVVTSFEYPVMLENQDADMLEMLLQRSDLSEGFALLLSSPGGSGLAAERVINICRSYSGTGQYTVIVPGKAKSAATMICLGSKKIIMAPTSELGSIDPQIVYTEGKRKQRFSAYNIIKSYENLFENAVNEKGNLQPYLQQLANYDAREIAEFRADLSLSEDIAIKALKIGMLSNLSKDKIRQQMELFLTPEEVKTHGRPIYAQDALNCGLNVEMVDIKGKFWSQVYKLHVWLNNHVSRHNIGKCIECKKYSFKAKIEEVR